ncbi:MAG: class I SAM-dependent methyltransferase, partial [Planctomycetes bacterium]|nr:class I SAM-dependent methyltransferase [Planctomycetota bacterium]
MRFELGAGDLERLERLRAAFLAGRGRSPWRDTRDLELYDATFGQRIAWKWAAVLDELAARGIELPAERVLDFGCGTGVAARAWLARPSGSATRALWLHDASSLAREHARGHVAREHPALRIELGLPAEPPDLLLASHVIGELAPMELD